MLVEYVSKNWDHVDILINNAGLLINKPFSETTTEDFNNIYATNVFGVAALINNMLPFAVKGTHVVNISSVGGVQGSVKFLCFLCKVVPVFWSFPVSKKNQPKRTPDSKSPSQNLPIPKFSCQSEPYSPISDRVIDFPIFHHH